MAAVPERRSWRPGSRRGSTEQGLAAPRASVEAHSTPRRLTACLSELVDRQEDKDETVMGPPVSAAFDAEGHPTNAGLGFARKLGADFDALQQVDTPRGKYLVVSSGARAAARPSTCCRTCSRKVLRDLTFPKQMHWDAQLEDDKGEFLFGRPIRWLLFLYGGRVVPFTIARLAVASSLARPGHHVGRRDLRPSVSRDERPRGPRDQGADVRRVPEEARGELRDPLAARAARPHPPRARSAGAPHRRPRAPAAASAGGSAARGSAGSRRVSRRSCPAPSARSSSRCPKKCCGRR